MLSDYARRKALRAVFGGELTLGLFVGGGEVSDANYERQPVRLDIGEDAVVTNGSDVRFPAFGADSEPVTGWALFDEDDKEVYRGELARPKAFDMADEPLVRAGEISIRLDVR